MRLPTAIPTWTILTTCLAIGAALAPVAAPAAKPLERFTAFAVDMGTGTARGARTGTVDIAIERWTTDAERDRLVAALREGQSDGLLKALRKMDSVGYIRSGGSIGYPLRFARQIPLPDGGRRILLGTDRPVSFLEFSRGGRSLDYPFMVIDMRLGPDGKGEGKLLPLARVQLDEDHVVEIENYTAEPVRLTSVHKAD